MLKNYRYALVFTICKGLIIILYFLFIWTPFADKPTFSQGEGSLDPLKKLVVEIIAFVSTLGSLETDSG